MKISTKKLLAKLEKRTTFPLTEGTIWLENDDQDTCTVCGREHVSDNIMLPEQYGAPVCMDCVHDIVDHVMCAHDNKKALKLKKK